MMYEYEDIITRGEYRETIEEISLEIQRHNKTISKKVLGMSTDSNEYKKVGNLICTIYEALSNFYEMHYKIIEKIQYQKVYSQEEFNMDALYLKLHKRLVDEMIINIA